MDDKAVLETLNAMGDDESDDKFDISEVSDTSCVDLVS